MLYVASPSDRRKHVSRVSALKVDPDNFASVLGYVDTVAVFWPCSLRREQIRDIRRHVGRIKVIRDRTRRLLGYSYHCTRPSVEKILLLDHLAAKYRGVLSRFDIAIDSHGVSSEHIRRSAILRWQSSGPMLDIGDTTYFVDYGKRRKRSNRNLALYDDKHNRFTGELDCTHVELRFLNAQSVRKQGINKVRDLLTINPKALCDKHIKWVDVSAIDAYGVKAVRQAIKDDIAMTRKSKRRGSKRAETFLDKYRARLKVLLKTQWHRGQLDRAQSGPHVYRKLKGVTCPLSLPTSLTFEGSLGSLNNFVKTRGSVY
jgi:hypothetical protein